MCSSDLAILPEEGYKFTGNWIGTDQDGAEKKYTASEVKEMKIDSNQIFTAEVKKSISSNSMEMERVEERFLQQNNI